MIIKTDNMSKVELISKTIGLNSYENLEPDEIIAAVARHGTIKKDNGRLVRYLMDHSHYSPLQHISYGFKIETRRSISAQIFRHRSLQFQEWSLRYSEPLGFEKIELRKEHPTNRQSSTDVIGTVSVDKSGWDYTGDFDHPAYNAIIKAADALVRIEEAYSEMVNSGIAKETVRDFLPLCTKTTIHVTGTLRDLLSFLNVRSEEHSQKEVREIAIEIGEALEKELPDVFQRIDWRDGMFM